MHGQKEMTGEVTIPTFIWRKGQGVGEDCIMSFITCTLYKILFQLSNQGDEMVMACSMHGRRDVHTKFLSENPKGRVHLEDLGRDGEIIRK